MKINLTIHDIHLLLNELEHLMKFANIYTSTSEYLHDKISHQLIAKELTVEDIASVRENSDAN